MMKTNDHKELPAGMMMRCYACDDLQATHVCRFQMDELMVQVCLCDECMKMDTQHLLKNTIGIDEAPQTTASDFLTT